MSGFRAFLFHLGSLRFAAVLLMLALVAMAYATFYESSHGLELARRAIYDNWWFQLILTLIAVNLTLAVVVRYPFTRRQIGFVITHSSVLVILAGAVVTGLWGVRGQITLVEGQSGEQFDAEVDMLSLREKSQNVEKSKSQNPQSEASTRLDIGSTVPIDNPSMPALTLDDVTVRALRFLPDAVPEQDVLNDGQEPNLALEVSVTQADEQETEWLFANPQSVRVGPLSVEVRTVSGMDELNAAVAAASVEESDAGAYLDISVGDKPYRIDVKPNIGKTVPVGDTDVRIDISNYFPHALVGAGGLRSASDRPVNPAVVLNVIRGERRQRQFCFALHPEFTHGAQEGLEDVKVRLAGIQTASGSSDVQLIVLPDGAVHVVFRAPGAKASDAPAPVGSAVQTPWPKTTLTLLQRFDRARTVTRLEPITPPGENPWPAFELEVRRGQERQRVNLRKHTPASVRLGDRTYELRFEYEQCDLGFTLTLDKFTVGTYPGTGRPRSFESQVRIVDDRTSRELGGVISMNAPLKYGGFTLYQSGYRQAKEGTSSTLSVARDPGMPIVFAGYGLAIIGMIVVLATRITVYRQAQALMNE